MSEIYLSNEYVEDGYKILEYTNGTIVKIKLVHEEQNVIVLEEEKYKLINTINEKTYFLIKQLDWRIERAKEQEQLGVYGESVNEVLLEREALRRASNRLVNLVNEITNVDEINSFSIDFTLTEEDYVSVNAMTQLEFIKKFTDVELETIVTLADTNALMKANLLKWQTAKYILKTDPMTVAAIDY